jgi:DNA-binding MarR family transcriptional regulator
MEAQELNTTTCMCSAIREMNRAVTQVFDFSLAPSGMKASQFMMLNAIAEAGEIAQCDFARRYAITVETLSRRFSKLRQKGLIASRTGAHSERIYRLTEEGERALRNSRPYWNVAQTRLKQALGDADWQLFFECCKRAVCAASLAEELRARNGWRVHMIEPNPGGQTGQRVA